MDMQSLHNILIILHATSATICFFAGGFLILSPKRAADQPWFNVYWWTLVGMVILLAGAILTAWTNYTTLERIIFPGLLVLAIYMLYRARNANLLRKSQPNHWTHGYVEHIGFTLISLFEGFIIVSGLNSGVSGWLVALFAILGVLIGRWLIGFAQRRVA